MIPCLSIALPMGCSAQVPNTPAPLTYQGRLQEAKAGRPDPQTKAVLDNVLGGPSDRFSLTSSQLVSYQALDWTKQTPITLISDPIFDKLLHGIVYVFTTQFGLVGHGPEQASGATSDIAPTLDTNCMHLGDAMNQGIAATGLVAQQVVGSSVPGADCLACAIASEVVFWNAAGVAIHSDLLGVSSIVDTCTPAYTLDSGVPDATNDSP
jgi:hypothetical protein